MIEIKWKKAHMDAKIPTFGSKDALCFDLYSVENAVILERQTKVISTGLIWQPEFIEPELNETFKIGMIIKPRSGLSVRHSLDVFAGVIDADYRGVIKIALHNAGIDSVKLDSGDRIAQGQIVLVPIVIFKEVDEIIETDRGEGGFGSSGK